MWRGVLPWPPGHAVRDGGEGAGPGLRVETADRAVGDVPHDPVGGHIHLAGSHGKGELEELTNPGRVPPEGGAVRAPQGVAVAGQVLQKVAAAVGVDEADLSPAVVMRPRPRNVLLVVKYRVSFGPCSISSRPEAAVDAELGDVAGRRAASDVLEGLERLLVEHRAALDEPQVPVRADRDVPRLAALGRDLKLLVAVKPPGLGGECPGQYHA